MFKSALQLKHALGIYTKHTLHQNTKHTLHKNTKHTLHKNTKQYKILNELIRYLHIEANIRDTLKHRVSVKYKHDLHVKNVSVTLLLNEKMKLSPEST